LFLTVVSIVISVEWSDTSLDNRHDTGKTSRSWVQILVFGGPPNEKHTRQEGVYWRNLMLEVSQIQSWQTGQLTLRNAMSFEITGHGITIGKFLCLGTALVASISQPARGQCNALRTTHDNRRYRHFDPIKERLSYALGLNEFVFLPQAFLFVLSIAIADVCLAGNDKSKGSNCKGHDTSGLEGKVQQSKFQHSHSKMKRWV
jgi:hypothetical protein